MGKWSVGRWVSGKWSLDRWSVVRGTVVGGFNKTRKNAVVKNDVYIEDKIPDVINSATNTPLSDCSWTQTHNQLVCKRILNHLDKHSASLAKWLSVHLRTNWLWVRVQLQSFKLQISRLL